MHSDVVIDLGDGTMQPVYVSFLVLANRCIKRVIAKLLWRVDVATLSLLAINTEDEDETMLPIQKPIDVSFEMMDQCLITISGGRYWR